ncbi:hypothetical protein glysoja_037515, partial [Glycine soja]
VKECWTSNHQRGWGGYVLKEKIKRLKEKLKLWNREQYGDTFQKYKKIEKELNNLEVSTSDRQLSPQEVMTKKQLQEDLWVVAQNHESLLRQKARSRWVKKGDCNSHYFHLLVNASRRSNSLNGVWIEDPTRVKEEARSFFFHRFQETDQNRPRLDGIRFQTIGHHQNDMLTGRFQEQEIKDAVWGCGSDKS